MLVSDKLVFTELHKTGGTHICRWLSKTVGGEQKGKHNRIPPYLWDRFILGSVRNPWDWYVSLWAFGCGGQGSVFKQTTRRMDFRYISRQLHSEMGRRRLGPLQWTRQLYHDACKPVAMWRDSYQDASDAEAFRKWLHLILAPERRFDIGEGFGFSPVSHQFGLMTYRYLKLFTALGNRLYKDSDLATHDGVRKAWAEKRLVGFVIRNESLEQDLIDALELSGHSLNKEDREALLEAKNARTNASSHFPAGYYYDSETIALVARREKLIIDSYGYHPPGLVGENSGEA